MYTFLLRSFTDKAGYAEHQYLTGSLPRTASESYVPWALTQDLQVVYAQFGQHRGFNHGIGLTPYTPQASQNRRRLCQSELGVLALNTESYSETAVGIISAGVKQYLTAHYQTDSAATVKCVVDNIGHYFFTGGRMGFGRLGEEKASTLDANNIWQKLLSALDTGTIAQQLAIHDAIGRKVLPKLKGPQLIKYEALGAKVRQAWFDDPKIRGRINSDLQNSRSVQPTHLGGIVNINQPSNIATVSQSRNRGVDMFRRDMHRTRHQDADAYYDEVDVRNLLFGAGISGTTGTLLQAAEAFGELNNLELKKQYMLAIIGYLVGGGMHSFHESMVIGGKTGIPYVAGAYITSLPLSFTNSPAFNSWHARYYDIVSLGAIHWLFNKSSLPSHLNTDLT